MAAPVSPAPPARSPTAAAGAEPVAPDRPERVLHPDQLGAEQLELGGGEPPAVVVELGVELTDRSLEIGHPAASSAAPADWPRIVAHARGPPEGGVGPLHVVGRLADRPQISRPWIERRDEHRREVPRSRARSSAEISVMSGGVRPDGRRITAMMPHMMVLLKVGPRHAL